jgi:hypothetical protein
MTQPVGLARVLPPFFLGFDVLQPCSDAMLSDAMGHGFRFVGRYLNNLTHDERDRIFAAGFGILPYTEAPTVAPLTSATGAYYGRAMVNAAALLAMPAGVHVAIDLEDPAEGSDCAAHVNAMAAALVAGGYGAALYVGNPQPLTGAELFALRPNRYIKAAGRVVDRFGHLAEPACDWCVLQLEPLEGETLGGVAVDIEVSKFDYEGRALTLWWPN